MPNQNDRYIIPSVVRALRVLEAFSLKKPTYTNAELSKKLGLNKSSVTRLLYSLEKAKFLKRNKETGAYALTHKTYQVGRVYIKQADYHTISMPVLDRLTARCNEASHLGVLDETQVLYLDWIQSNQPVSLASLSGKKLPAYCTGVGKNFLAYMDAETLSSYLENTQLIPYTGNTITDSEQLQRHLKQVKKQRYAVDNCEFQQDVISVSGPIFNETGTIIAGISVAGPKFRMNDTVLETKIIPEVKQAAMDISRQLGWDMEYPVLLHNVLVEKQ